MMSLSSGCGPEAGYAIKAVCDVWRDSLPTGSARDTTETLREIDIAHEVQEGSCP